MGSLAWARDADEVDSPLDGRATSSLHMSEAEFEAWAGPGTRAEWVDGEVVLMSPTSLRHNRLTFWFAHLIGEFLARKPLGELLGIEFMVRLAGQRRRRLPDLFFVSNERKSLLRPTYLDGAPDLALEIVSADSQSRDRREKYLEYEKAGVREYWIVDPLSQTVEAYTLYEHGAFILIPELDGWIASAVLPGFRLRSQWLWHDPLPRVDSALSEMGVASAH